MVGGKEYLLYINIVNSEHAIEVYIKLKTMFVHNYLHNLNISLFIGYVQRLFDELIRRAEDNVLEEREDHPKPLCWQYERPCKDIAVQSKMSRFHK